MKEYQVKTDIFTISEGEWKILIGGAVLPTTWNSRGAAIAGLETECKRRGIHQLSSDCWCQPVTETPYDRRTESGKDKRQALVRLRLSEFVAAEYLPPDIMQEMTAAIDGAVELLRVDWIQARDPVAAGAYAVLVDEDGCAIIDMAEWNGALWTLFGEMTGTREVRVIGWQHLPAIPEGLK